jgi:AcrR family transcriptional regulator
VILLAVAALTAALAPPAPARRVDVGATGTLFNYFPSKNALIDAVYLHLKHNGRNVLRALGGVWTEQASQYFLHRHEIGQERRHTKRHFCELSFHSEFVAVLVLFKGLNT